MDWIDLAQDRDRWQALVNAAVNLRIPHNTGNFLNNWGPIGFWRRSLLRGVSFNFTYDMSWGYEGYEGDGIGYESGAQAGGVEKLYFIFFILQSSLISLVDYLHK